MIKFIFSIAIQRRTTGKTISSQGRDTEMGESRCLISRYNDSKFRRKYTGASVGRNTQIYNSWHGEIFQNNSTGIFT